MDITKNHHNGGNKEIEILSENADLTMEEDAVFRFPGSVDENRDLHFRCHYTMRYRDYSSGIKDCDYAIHGKQFRDLSFMGGDEIEALDGGFKVKKSAGKGNLVITYYADIPTFDSADREWDSDYDFALYHDSEGVDALMCRSGYKISKINAYIGLVKALLNIKEMLMRIGCPDFGIEFIDS